MTKIITSPSTRFFGTVYIAEPLTCAQAEAIEAAMEINIQPDEKIWYTVLDKKKLPAIFACVEKWELSNLPENITSETFPFSPRKDTHQLIDWLYDEIRKVYLGELEIPNESRPTPSAALTPV